MSRIFKFKPELLEECLIFELIDILAPHISKLEQRSIQLALVDELICFGHAALCLCVLVHFLLSLFLLVLLADEHLL